MRIRHFVVIINFLKQFVPLGILLIRADRKRTDVFFECIDIDSIAGFLSTKA
jgi:hypothetical protein